MNRPTAFLGAVLLVLTGLSVGIPFGLNVAWSFSYFLPVWAAWTARSRGIPALWPILLCAVLPTVVLNLSGFWIRLGWPASHCFLAAGVGLLFESRANPSQWVSLFDRRRLAIAGALLWFVLSAGRGTYEVHWQPGLTTTFNLLAITPVLMLVAALNWESCAAALQPTVRKRVTYIVLSVLALLLIVQIRVAPFDSVAALTVGASSSAFTAIACFLAVGLRWISFSKLCVVVVGCVAFEALLAVLIGHSSGHHFARMHFFWNFGFDGRLAMFDGLEAACAGVLGHMLSYCRKTGAASEARGAARFWAEWTVLLCTTLAIAPFSGLNLWILAGLAFLSGLRLQFSRLWMAGISIQSLTLMAMVAAAGVNRNGLLNDLVSVGSVALTYAFFGSLARRAAVRSADVPGVAPIAGRTVLDVTAVADAVQQVDRQTTLRAFGVLLLPLLILLSYGDALIALHRYGFWQAMEDEPAYVAMALLIGAGSALAPFGFVVLDAMNRRTRLWPLSAVSGGLIGIVGISAAGAALAGIHMVTRDVFDEERAAFVTAALAALLLCTLLLVGLWKRRPARPALATLVVISLLCALLALRGKGMPDLSTAEWGEFAWQAGTRLIILVPLLFFWSRAFRLRYILAYPAPRELFYGPLRQSGLLVRLAAAFGLPSSMWNRKALRGAAFWTLLASRPLVYAAALTNGDVTASVLFVIAGHAAFVAGKRLASHSMWVPGKEASLAPILFLRSFDNDQFEFRRRWWDIPSRWFDLWSFRRNADELLVDEAAQYAPVVALGNPDDRQPRFGARRHFAEHQAWKSVVLDTALRSTAIVLVAGESPSLRWETAALREHGLTGRTILLFHPDVRRQESNLSPILFR